MSRIIKLTAENVQRVKAVEITPPRNVVVIGGKNGNGKSSTLDAISMGIGGGDEISDMPVRRGAEKARIILELEDLIIKRTFTVKEDGTASSVLVIENKDGARYPKPQDMLDKLTGKLTFDPLAFMLKKPPERLEALKRIVKLDFMFLDAKRASLYAERSVVNAQAKSAAARAEFMPHHPDAPLEEQSITAIVEERDTAKEHNAKKPGFDRAIREASEVLEDAALGRKSLENEIEQTEARLKSLRAQVTEYDEALPAFRTRLAAAQESLAAFKLTDLSPINLRLAGAEQVNAKVRQNNARDAALRDANAIAAKSDALTSQITEIDKQKGEQLAAVKFPVAGLSFNDGDVLFNDVPFDQASDAEKLRVSVAMGIALNPKLKVLLVRNASLLDEDSMKLLTELAIDADVQLWLEVVSTDAGKCSVIIEDGCVQVPAEAVAATD